MSNETYEGWKNRETWAIQLHLNNNEGDYLHMQEQARGIVQAFQNDRDDQISQMADVIKDWTREVFEETLDIEADTYTVSREARMFVSDVGSYWRADFYEIAESWIDEAREELRS